MSATNNCKALGKTTEVRAFKCSLHCLAGTSKLPYHFTILMCKKCMGDAISPCMEVGGLIKHLYKEIKVERYSGGALELHFSTPKHLPMTKMIHD